AAAGRTPIVLEASDAVGGRLRTDVVDGYRLDRGFAVLFEAYPEAQAQLDLAALDLQRFEPGADVYLGAGRFATVSDPRREPSQILATLRSGLWRPGDVPALLRWRSSAHHRLEATAAETTGDQRLRDLGLSTPLRERFLRPLFTGIFLDRELGLSSLLLDQAFAMMAAGATSVPNAGMGAIAEQLAARLPDGVRLGARVRRVVEGGVELESGARIDAREVVVATAPLAGAALSGTALPTEPRSSTALWFSMERAPAGRRIVLDGSGEGPVTTVAVLSAVAPGYAPRGRQLVCASCPGLPHVGSDLDLERAVRRQLHRWFGDDVPIWQLLRVDRIPWAQHAQPPGSPAQLPVRVRPGLVLAGDGVENASIDGALRAGRRAAEALLH
ncbi:MAG: NAD(P)/FAD-dependent oxidoreductase, partial [Gaiellales bacterium]